MKTVNEQDIRDYSSSTFELCFSRNHARGSVECYLPLTSLSRPSSGLKKIPRRRYASSNWRMSIWQAMPFNQKCLNNILQTTLLPPALQFRLKTSCRLRSIGEISWSDGLAGPARGPPSVKLLFSLFQREPQWDWATPTQQNDPVHHRAIGHGPYLQRPGSEAWQTDHPAYGRLPYEIHEGHWQHVHRWGL